jgi:hypothetical protein
MAATIVNVIYVGGQLAEMRSGSEQTDKLISSNANLASAAKDQATAATMQANISESGERAWIAPIDYRFINPTDPVDPMRVRVFYKILGASRPEM